MAPRSLDDIASDGQYLRVGADVESGNVRCEVPQEMIDALRPCSGINVRDIPGDRRNMVAKLRPFPTEKLSRTASGEMLELLSWEAIDRSPHGR